MIVHMIEYFIVKGTGSNQPKGVDALTYVDGTNGVDYAAAKPTARPTTAGV